jgi:deoxyribodipyrimidine photo-lyase
MAATEKTALVWLRRDLRLAENPALHAAMSGSNEVCLAFVLDEMTPGGWGVGGASRWWLHQSLTALAKAVDNRGGRLVLRRGESVAEIVQLARETDARTVHVGEVPEPWARRMLERAESELARHGVDLVRHRSALLFDPDEIRTGSGGYYGVFTPFSRACVAHGVTGSTQPAPKKIACTRVASDNLDDWELLPRRPDWAGGLRATWTPGEDGAAERLKAFLSGPVQDYADARNQPGIEGTSMLSPHLHWGEISPLQVWQAIPEGRGSQIFRNELLWREFSAHLLWRHTALPETPLRSEFADMPWRDDAEGIKAWKEGKTGLPIVDAGMRQLWQIGWMHNRVRMVVASFLIKHLMVDWRTGEAWFWDTLVDADLSSNAANWQWVAGCGADAAPYFRVFNPVLQGKKFDADGAYVRRYVPELAALPDRFIHAPWDAPDDVLKMAGIQIGVDYPAPIVDLAAGRDRALDAFRRISRKDAA